jgi:serine kinase of HPr protein (carbohydrate metabolism regulator)
MTSLTDLIGILTTLCLQELLTTLQRKEEEIYQSQVNIENIKKYVSELQAYLVHKQIQGISTKNANYLQSLVGDGKQFIKVVIHRFP